MSKQIVKIEYECEQSAYIDLNKLSVLYCSASFINLVVDGAYFTLNYESEKHHKEQYNKVLKLWKSNV